MNLQRGITARTFHVWGDDYFRERSTVSPTTGCWVWSLYKDPKGYGRLTYKRKSYAAHRFSYEIFIGDPGPLHVCHKCDNPSCVNPLHLWLGSNKENHRDKINKGRQGYTHEFSNANCKLSDEQVLVIRAAYNKFEISYRTLGRLFNVNHRLIGRIITMKERKNAKHPQLVR